MKGYSQKKKRRENSAIKHALRLIGKQAADYRLAQRRFLAFDRNPPGEMESKQYMAWLRERSRLADQAAETKRVYDANAKQFTLRHGRMIEERTSTISGRFRNLAKSS